jgi:phage terminase small subunit
MAAKAKVKPPGSGFKGNVPKSMISGKSVPPEVKKLRGTFHPANERKKKANQALAVVTESGRELALPLECTAEDLKAPKSLINVQAVDEWNNFIVPLVKAGIIKSSDLRFAEMYCDLWGLYEIRRAQLRLEEDHRKVIFYPTKLVKEMGAMLSHMGLTPVARSKVIAYVAATKKADIPKDGWKDILNDDD